MEKNQNINAIYKNTLEKENLQSQIEKSTNFYAPQPFVKENYSLFQLSKVFHVVFSIFSIITGFGFLYFLFADYLWYVVSGFLALILLIGLELVKSVSLEMSIKRLYQRRLSGLSFFGLLCVCVSVLFSVLGAKELFEHLDKSVHSHKTSYQKELKNIAQEYDKKIQQEKEELKSFKESVTWQGKINLHDNNIAKNINSHLGRVDSLISQKNKALHKATLQGEKENQILLQESNFNLWAWLSVSLSNEFLLLLCVWYACHYHWHTQKERAILTDIQTYKTTAQELQNFIGLYLSSPKSELLGIESAGSQVGFSFSKKPNESPKKEDTAIHTYPSNDTPLTSKNKTSFGIDICECCGEKYPRKTHNQKFCSEKCRIESWESKTGKKLNLKK